MLRLEDRLKTRFEWGLIADIQPPDFETRMAIIKNKSVSLGFDLPNDVCTFIAENVTSNVRLLEGTVKKIRAYHDLDNMELTVPNVSRAIKDMYNKEKPRICQRRTSSSAKSPGSITLRNPSSAARSRTRTPPRRGRSRCIWCESSRI